MEQQEKSLTTNEIYNGRVIKVRIDKVQLADGRETKREIVEHSGGVAILAINDNNELLLVEQYRKAAEQSLLELPAGKLEKGEDPVDCAIRELVEETGYKAEKLKYLFSFYTTPGFCNELLHLYQASCLKEVGVKPDEDEIIENHQLKKEEILNYIKSGKIKDGKTITGLMYYLAGDCNE